MLDGYTGAIKCIHGFTMEALEDSEITYEVMDEGFLFADGAEGVAEAVAGIDYFYDQNPDAERWYNAHPVFKQNAPDQGSPLRATDPSFWRT